MRPQVQPTLALDIGDGRDELRCRHPIGWTVLGALVAALPATWMWGFTVDDALISVRYARHLDAGLGWRFNAGGLSTDGVTPLPWPILLAPFARAGAIAVLHRAKWLGLSAWTAAGAALGRRIGSTERAPSWARAASLAAVSLCVPLAAHAVSGMETAVATLLATLAALERRTFAASCLAGLAAAFRPELAAWACAIAAGVALAQRQPVATAIGAGVVALLPFSACAAIRVVAWGHPAPLALLAKPSDATAGLAYAGASFVVTLLPLLVLAPIALRRCPRAMAIVLAAVVHAAAVIAVGGDWMPYARLSVPVLPSLAFAACLGSARAHPLATAARSSGAVALGVVLLARGATRGRHVGPDREALVASARPWLEGARRVAALDVGWVGAATEADIVDLAGVTDPEIAALPGGHTSKRVSATFLLERAPDVLLLYAGDGLPEGGLDAWRDATYPRIVEARLARDDVIAHRFRVAAWLPLGGYRAGYVLLERRSESD
jgi:hypothetical protein